MKRKSGSGELNYPEAKSNGWPLRGIFEKPANPCILDEATSALDLESEHFIQEALDILAKNRTTIIVAHRLSTITHADRIIHIDNGEITEMGTHEELMKKQGHYYNLFQVQQLDS